MSIYGHRALEMIKLEMTQLLDENAVIYATQKGKGANQNLRYLIRDKDNASRSGSESEIQHGPSMKIIKSSNDMVTIIITKDASGNPDCFVDPKVKPAQLSRFRKEIPVAIEFANKNCDILIDIWFCGAGDRAKEIELIDKLKFNNKNYNFRISI